jgi:YidC/Oxa1 family membrane protein insertase
MLANLLEQILVYFHQLTNSYGISIILLSLAVTIIMVPLYWFAEILQQKERDRKSAMQSGLDEIKDLKNKQEKYYYTKELYRQHNYKSYYALTGLIGLAIQVPFFIAAYWMLLEYTPLKGIPFGPIKDLSQPDQIFAIAGMAVNTLPIIMTLVNLLGIFLQHKYMNKNEAVQLSVIAIIFLVLLYDLPAGLVLYWTMNNVFAIGKNWLLSRFIKQSIENGITNNDTKICDVLRIVRRINVRNIVMTMSIIAIHLFFTFSLVRRYYPITNSHKIPLVISVSLIGILVIISLIDFFKRNTTVFLKTIISLSVIIVYAIPVFLFANSSFGQIFGITNTLITLFYIQIIYLAAYVVLNNKKFVNDELKERVIDYKKILPFFLLLFPLITYHFNNLEYFTLATITILYYSILFIMPILTIILILYIFNGLLNRNLAIVTFLSVILTTYLLPIATNIFKMTSDTNVLTYIGSLIFVYGILRYSYFNYSEILNYFSIVVLLISIVNGLTTKLHSTSLKPDVLTNKNTKLYDHLQKYDMKYKPDIYLLVYDSYVPDSQMRFYDIDNSEFHGFLKEKGFVIHNNTYTNASGSRISMSGVLDIRKGSPFMTSGINQNKIIGGNSIVDNILQKNGYRTNYILNNYLLRGKYNFGGDYVYPIASKYDDLRIVITSILLGEFKHDIQFIIKHNKYSNKDWEQKRTEIFRSQSEQPKFMYSHSGFPGHSSNRGKLLPEDFILYKTKLKEANLKIRNDLTDILSSKKDAVVIIAGDHGPFLTKDGYLLEGYNENEINGIDLLTRYGAFLAIKYPESIELVLEHDIVLLQNLFVYIFSDLFEDDGILNYKIEPTTFSLWGGHIPDGVIDNGEIMYGVDKGKNIKDILYNAE